MKIAHKFSLITKMGGGIAVALALPLVNIESAQAIITTFADADSTAFDTILGGLVSSSSTTLDFDSEPDGLLSSSGETFGSDPTLTITHTNLRNQDLSIAGRSDGLDPIGTKQVFANATQNQEAIINFSFDQPINYFGIYVGDVHDVAKVDASRFDLSAEGTKIVDNIIAGVGTVSPDTVTYPDTDDASGQLTVGNNLYNFFGIVDDTNTFSSVTLTLDSNGDHDNFAFDSITYGTTYGTVSVPFEFSPSMGLVIVGLGFGGLKYRRAKLNKKDLSK